MSKFKKILLLKVKIFSIRLGILFNLIRIQVIKFEKIILTIKYTIITVYAYIKYCLSIGVIWLKYIKSFGQYLFKIWILDLVNKSEFKFEGFNSFLNIAQWITILGALGYAANALNSNSLSILFLFFSFIFGFYFTNQFFAFIFYIFPRINNFKRRWLYILCLIIATLISMKLQQFLNHAIEALKTFH